MLIFFVKIGVGLSVLAQNNDPFNLNYVPPTPNNASLFKSTEYPISLSTGSMNVSVPVYSFSKNSLNLSIDFNYQTQGIRVEEIASNVGLGWSLNAGGVIMRQIRGTPDDYSPQGYMYLGNNQNPTGQEFQYANNAKDSEQDIFNFSFPGGSGKFILKASGEPILFGQRKLKVEVSTGNTGTLTNISSFVITDENGIRYTYDILETTYTTISPLLPSYFNYVSAWHLKKIENVFTNESIIFNYSTANVVYKTRNAQTLKRRVMLIDQHPTPNTPINVSVGSNENPQYNEIKDINTTGVRITSITLPDNSEIQFQYSSQKRADVGNDYALTQINILNDNDALVKAFKLTQDYIDDQGIVQSYSSVPPDETQYPYGRSNIRMRLTEVQELSFNQTANPPYKFEYDNSFRLPDRFSPKQDHWGYYNGEKNTAGDIIVSRAVYRNSLGYQLLDGADRIPDPNAVKAASLKKVTYPTGGYLQLDYEINQAGDGKLIDSTLKQYAVLIANPEGSTNTMQTFTVNRLENNDPIKFKFKLLSTLIPSNNGCLINLYIKTDDLSTTICSVTFDVGEVGVEKSFQVNSLANGTYKAVWEITPAYCAGLSTAFNMRIYWNQLEINTDQYAGGLRIKKTSYSDGSTGSLPVVKEYKYVTETGQSSGVVFRKPRYSMVINEFTEETNQTATVFVIENLPSGSNQILYWSGGETTSNNSIIKYYLYSSSVSNYPLTYSSGQNIMYTRVEVIYSGSGSTNIGKEANYYRTYKDNSLYNNPNIFFASPPFLPVQPNDWELGLLTKKLIYDNNQNLKEKEENTYYIQASPVDDQKNFRVGHYFRDFTPGGCSNYNLCNGFIVQDYFWQVGKSELTQSVKTTYKSSSETLVQTANYTYDPVYFSLKKQSTINSSGSIIERRVYYPYDYTMGGVLQQMVNANITATPVSNEVWKIDGANEELISANAIEYKSVSGLFVPDKFYVLSTTAPINKNIIGSFNSSLLLRDPSKYSLDITFENYDSKNNILQLENRGSRKSYIWDNPLNSHPIAEVANGTVSEIAYSSFETDTKGNWSYNGSGIADGTAPTGKRCYDVVNGNISKAGLNVVNAYIVSYWTKNVSPFNVTGTINGFPIQGRSINGWRYFEHKIIGQNQITIGGSGLIDEVRLYPEKSLMTTYTYEPLIGMSSQCDANNRILTANHILFN